MRRHPPVEVPGLPRFTGGAVGYLGYDIVRTHRVAAQCPAGRPGSPGRDSHGGRYAAGAGQPLQPCHRHRQRGSAGGREPEKPAAICSMRRRPGSSAGSERLATPTTSRRWRSSRCRDYRRPRVTYPDHRFQEDVGGSRSTSRAGDTFQTVLSAGSTCAAPEPFLTYRYLRALNPAPYLYYLHCDDIHVIGSSPEDPGPGGGRRGYASVRSPAPVLAGSRRSEDAALAAELAADPKERAEHLMLVDLGRNDVGRVAEFGSVAADRVHGHRALLPRDAPGERSAGAAARPSWMPWPRWRACFPAGTVSRGAQGPGDGDHR